MACPDDRGGEGLGNVGGSCDDVVMVGWKRIAAFYHGGVPGKQPGDPIFPAIQIGLDYTAAYVWAPGVMPQMPKYRPDLVYFSTHLGVARGYAARYQDPLCRQVPGDVYRVAVAGPVETDPDFDHPKLAGIYGASNEPVIVEAVVERGVALDRRQQNEVGWPYQCFYARWEEEVHARDGTVLASEEMRELGATEEYLRLLPKWMDITEFANDGRLWSPGLPGVCASPDQVLDILAHLDLDTGPHVITNEYISVAPFVERGSNSPILFGHLQCRECGARFGERGTRLGKQAALDAAVHQAGDELAVIAQFNGGLDGYLRALARRAPTRWSWTSLPQ